MTHNFVIQVSYKEMKVVLMYDALAFNKEKKEYGNFRKLSSERGRIKINLALSDKRAKETIAHELIHALQAKANINNDYISHYRKLYHKQMAEWYKAKRRGYKEAMQKRGEFVVLEESMAWTIQEIYERSSILKKLVDELFENEQVIVPDKLWEVLDQCFPENAGKHRPV